MTQIKKTDLPAKTLCSDPTVDKTCFLAEGSRVVGDVRLGRNVSIWYNAVLRGDINYISIDDNSNIQDGSVIHVTNDKPCIIGKNVTIGHHVNLHACTIDEGVLVGIGAIILTGAHIKKGSIIGAGSVVLENTVVEENSLYVGIPAKKVKELDGKAYQENLEWAQKYTKLAKLHQQKYQSGR